MKKNIAVGSAALAECRLICLKKTGYELRCEAERLRLLRRWHRVEEHACAMRVAVFNSAMGLCCG